MSQRIKALIDLSKMRNNSTFSRLYSSYNAKDFLKQLSLVDPPAASTPPDYLLENLKESRSVQNVLELVGSHHKIMNSKQLMQALRSLYTLQKCGNSNLSASQIIQHSHFEKLCHKLKTQAGMLELNESIEAFKVVSYVGVPSSSTIMQVLLQLLRHNINDFSLQNIIFLDFLLSQLKSSPLADGLLIALPIVFEVNLPMKMDRENIIHLTEYLKYASKRPVSDTCVKLLMDTLLNCIQKHDLRDAKVAKTIIWSLCDMKQNDYFEPLVSKAINALIKLNVDQLEYNEIQTTLSKLISNYSHRFPFYYNDVLIDMYANHVADNDYGLEESAYTLRKLTRIAHTNDNLLNYFCKQCYNNPTDLQKIPPSLMYNIATTLALSDFKPIYWDVIKEALASTKSFHNYNKPDIIWLKLAVSLCALDIYRSDIIENAFNERNLQAVLNQGFPLDYENFLLLYQTIETLQPAYKYLLPSKSMMKTMLSKKKPVADYPLQKALVKVLGGENYVKTCLKTELGHHIDHVIVTRKGGYPTALPNNFESQNLEEYQLSPDSQMVCILALNEHHYTLNSKRMKATSSLLIKTLEAKGMVVIPICLDTWNSLAEFEKIPYLMQSIKTKTDDNNISVSNINR